MDQFLLILAWVFGVGSTLLALLAILGAFLYNDLDKAIDRAQGVERTYPVMPYAVIACVCWAWIISH